MGILPPVGPFCGMKGWCGNFDFGAVPFGVGKKWKVTSSGMKLEDEEERAKKGLTRKKVVVDYRGVMLKCNMVSQSETVSGSY